MYVKHLRAILIDGALYKHFYYYRLVPHSRSQTNQEQPYFTSISICKACIVENLCNSLTKDKMFPDIRSYAHKGSHLALDLHKACR